MKYLIISIILTGFVLTSHAQGIRFFEGTWQEALNKAKAENKPLFVDVYTTWCGPCRKMVNEIFPLPEVGDKYNASFINYKTDAEKGEGIEIAKKYKVNSFPTYIFVNGEGTLLYRSLGSMPSDKFLGEADIAVTEFKDPKPFAVWQDEYDTRKNDAAWMLDYIKKRMKLKMNSGKELDQYFNICTKEEILDSELIPFLTQFQHMNSDGPFYQFLFQHKEEVRTLLKEKYNKTTYVDEFLIFIAKQDVERAIEKKDEALLDKIVKILLDSKPDELPVDWREGEAKMKYFTRTHQPERLKELLKKYGESVINYNISKIRQLDSIALARFEQDLADGKIKVKPENLEALRKIRGSSNTVSYAYRVRDLANAVFNVIEDKRSLKKALKWIDHATLYSDNFTIYEAKAGILYKLGESEKAIDIQRNAIKMYQETLAELNMSNSQKISGRLENTLKNMIEGIPTWQSEN